MACWYDVEIRVTLPLYAADEADLQRLKVAAATLVGERLKRLRGRLITTPQGEVLAGPPQLSAVSIGVAPVPEEGAGDARDEIPACILTGAPGENPDDCTTHDHEE